ncbi:hypothetical protein Ancab_012641 [Ancistrocladus abbreviatus]
MSANASESLPLLRTLTFTLQSGFLGDKKLNLVNDSGPCDQSYAFRTIKVKSCAMVGCFIIDRSKLLQLRGIMSTVVGRCRRGGMEKTDLVYSDLMEFLSDLNPPDHHNQSMLKREDAI